MNREKNNTGPIVGQSPAMEQVKVYLEKVAATDSTVLVTGETGTGKELVAELIHRKSSRHNMPLICVNCASLPETLIESELFGHEKGAFTGAVTARKGQFALAAGGTLFLDEIGDMKPFAQAKILRSLENGRIRPLGGGRDIIVDVRIIAATNRRPEALIAEGTFRKDLFYRLNIARIHLPPLRERKEDITLLVRYGIRKMNKKIDADISGMADNAMEILMDYHWPGNVRELMNLLEATFINRPSDKINISDLPKLFMEQIKKATPRPFEERRRVISALLETNWNKSTAAKRLNWSRMTLYRKMAKLHIVEKRNTGS